MEEQVAGKAGVETEQGVFLHQEVKCPGQKKQ